MKVFLSWSKPRSRQVAETLRTWLPKLIPGVEPFISLDVDSGDVLLQKVLENLRNASLGICCLTRENYDRPWILFEAGALLMETPERKKPKVCALLLDVPEELAQQEPLGIFKYTKLEKEEFRQLLHTIYSIMPESERKVFTISDLDNEFERKWECLYRRLCEIRDRQAKYWAIMIAAGSSVRWRASIRLHKTSQRYRDLFWMNVCKILEDRWRDDNSEGLRNHRGRPPSSPKLHKSLAILKSIPLITHGLLRMRDFAIYDVSVMYSSKYRGKGDILHYLDQVISATPSQIDFRVRPFPVHKDGDVGRSIFEGLRTLPTDADEVIVSYTDIVWEKRLLHKLLDHQGDDIVVLVDRSWKLNYPPDRIWHNKLFAELAFCSSENPDPYRGIERMGECIRRFEYTGNERGPFQADFESACSGVFDDDRCIGEVIGLVRFSQKGWKAFKDEYSSVEHSGGGLSRVPWEAPHSSGSSIKPKRASVHINRALLGDVIEHLIDKRKDIRIVPELVDGGWAEIDHWGDLCIAMDRLSGKRHPVLHL